jgi:hypothetical protein
MMCWCICRCLKCKQPNHGYYKNTNRCACAPAVFELADILLPELKELIIISKYIDSM